MNANPWIKFTDQPPKVGDKVEVWDDYDEQVLTGFYRSYDGRYVQIGMRHWSMEISRVEFSHWRIAEPESEYPTLTEPKP